MQPQPSKKVKGKRNYLSLPGSPFPTPKHLKQPTPQPIQSTLLHLPPRRAINNLSPLPLPTPGLIPAIKNPNSNMHTQRTKNTHPQNPHHHQITLPELQPSFRIRILAPPLIQRIRSHDRAEISPPRDNSRCSSNADLAVPRLEELCCPGHGYGHCRAESEPDD